MTDQTPADSQKDEFPPESYGFPDEEYMSCQDGLPENHHYRDMRGFDRSDFERLCADEKILLEYEGDLDSDDAFEDIGDNEVWMLDLDPGVASSVIALRAVGAVPFTCCNGGEGHYEQHPLVAFWADKNQVDVIWAAAQMTGVEMDFVGEPGFMIYTHGDVSIMMAFAQELISSTA